MSCRPNRFRGLVYDGDWHRMLVDAAQLAKAGTRSKDLLAAVEVLEQQLAKTDECLHTVTALQAVPSSIDVQFLMKHIEQCIDIRPATLQLTSTGEIELMITARGSREHVQSMATVILSSGLSRAEAEIWAEVTFRSGGRGQHI